MKWVPTVLCVIILFGLVTSGVGTDPKLQTNSVSIFQRVTWSAQECARCPYGYQCSYNAWLPSLTLNGPVWVFGITNNASTGGILHFREYPDDPCRISCQDYIPVLYTAEVVYVPYQGGVYYPEDVPITYIPKGQYVVTSPSFPIQYNMKLWYFPDDGNGPELMDVVLKTDKEKYKREDTSVIFSLQVTDEETSQFIQVDSIFGEIILPDSTRKTVEPEDWVWDEQGKYYEYTWDFTNDNGVCADPKEGFYSAEMTVKKKYYKDVTVYTDFDVCYHVNMNLEFNKNPPDYVLGEPVTMAVFVTDENGIPVRAGLESVVVVPGGDIYSDVLWVEITPGLYTASYVPHQEGEYSITVTVKEDYTCYGEDASATFSVECDTALVYWTISTVIIGEPAQFLLMITDTDGDFLPGAFIDTDIYYQDEYIATLTWTYDDENSIYTAQYTFSELGVYDVTGAVTVFKENTCFTSSVTEHFTVIKKDLPDLVIHNEDIVIEPDPHLNTTVTISVTVWNFGRGDAECFWVILLINDYIVHREPIALLTAGEKFTFMYEWTILYSGGYIIQAIADPPEGLI